jgi:hypothetical protein
MARLAYEVRSVAAIVPQLNVSAHHARIVTRPTSTLQMSPNSMQVTKRAPCQDGHQSHVDAAAEARQHALDVGFAAGAALGAVREREEKFAHE